MIYLGGDFYETYELKANNALIETSRNKFISLGEKESSCIYLAACFHYM
jgi:hypothetical protein